MDILLQKILPIQLDPGLKPFEPIVIIVIKRKLHQYSANTKFNIRIHLHHNLHIPKVFLTLLQTSAFPPLPQHKVSLNQKAQPLLKDKEITQDLTHPILYQNHSLPNHTYLVGCFVYDFDPTLLVVYEESELYGRCYVGVGAKLYEVLGGLAGHALAGYCYSCYACCC